MTDPAADAAYEMKRDHERRKANSTPACSKCLVHAAEVGDLCPRCLDGPREPTPRPGILDSYAAFVDLIRPQ